MAKLKLGAIADEKPVKLTVELPARNSCAEISRQHFNSIPKPLS